MSNELLKKVKLLFIEDDAVQRDELSTFLKRRVDKIYVAENGEEGLEKYRLLKPDIILTDLRMPKMDGLEFAKSIRKENRLVPIIIITAMNDRETILKSVDIGITNYVVKPVVAEELMLVLEESVKTLLEMNNAEFETIVEKDKVNALKNELTKHLKLETGKGPLDIRVEMKYNQCTITIMDSLTIYEKKLLKNGQNATLVDNCRNIFFKDRKEDIEWLLKEHLQLTLMLSDVKSDSENDEIVLSFKLV
ncbi:MAG: DUF2294 family protein [Clostridia bacterium]|nr:DUF2294 family protein [Clostridia bacterium]